MEQCILKALISRIESEESKKRVADVKVKFRKQKSLISKKKINIESKKVWEIFHTDTIYYRTVSWTLRKIRAKYLDNAEMWLRRKWEGVKSVHQLLKMALYTGLKKIIIKCFFLITFKMILKIGN